MLQTISKPNTTTIKKFDKACKGGINSGGKAVCERTRNEKSDKCIKSIINKNLTNFLSLKA